ncbi:MAG: hypothetical protein QXO44_00835 [Thermoplasmatales archaeon]
MPLSRRRPERQRRLFQIALSIKRGRTRPSYSPQAAKIARTLSERKIRKIIRELS